MNELNLTTPSLLFSAISLILLAYTNRFLSYASVVRSLNEKYLENPDKDPTTLNQIRNFVLRLRLIRAMQTLGATSLVFCLAAMFFYFINYRTAAEIIFGIGMIMLAASLGLCIWEIQISTEAISLHLQNIRRRQREQDPYMGNTLRRNANRREGETLGELNTRKNQEKQRREKQEREERKAKERAEQQANDSDKINKTDSIPKEERKTDNLQPTNNNAKKNNNQRNQTANKQPETKTEQNTPQPVNSVNNERSQQKEQQRESNRERIKQVRKEDNPNSEQPNTNLQVNKINKEEKVDQQEINSNKSKQNNRREHNQRPTKERSQAIPQTIVSNDQPQVSTPKPHPIQEQSSTLEKPSITKEAIVEKVIAPEQANAQLQPNVAKQNETISFTDVTSTTEDKKVRKIFANRKPKVAERVEQTQEVQKSRYQERRLAKNATNA